MFTAHLPEDLLPTHSHPLHVFTSFPLTGPTGREKSVGGSQPKDLLPGEYLLMLQVLRDP